MFDLLDAQTEFDEAPIKKAISSKYYRVVKNRLYNQVVDSLASFNASSTVQGELRKCIEHGRNFYQNGSSYW